MDILIVAHHHTDISSKIMDFYNDDTTEKKAANILQLCNHFNIFLIVFKIHLKNVWSASSLKHLLITLFF